MNPNRNSKRLQTHARCLGSRRPPARKRGFLLIMVLLVISTLSLAALNFSDSMLIAHEASRLDSKRFQARMMAESGIQAARLFAASPPALRTEMGGSWDNPQKFQALNIVPSTDPTFRGNVTLIAPSLDQSGAIAGIRYGLQNESAKLNLNALIELDKLARSAATAGAAGSAGGSGGGGAGFPGGAQGGFGGGQNGGGQNNGRGGQNNGGQGGGQNNGGQGGGNNGGGGGGGQGNGGQVQQQGGGGGAGGQNNQGGQNQGGNNGGGGGGGGGGGNFGGGNNGGGGNGNNNGRGNGNNGGGFGGGFGGGGFGGAAGGASGGQAGGLSALAAAAGQDLAAKMLMALPGMTQDVADAILDFIDADDEPRPYGAEYADYYQQMQPAYKPANGPLTSIEQLLLVRGVTPQLLFGYDQNRNGVIDASEQSQMLMGAPAGAMPGSMPLPTASGSGSDTQPSMPGPLGWAPYLTLHSQEKNVASDGTPRININGSDLQALYDELVPAVGDQWASYIIAYRIGGQKPAGAASPLQALLTAAASTVTEDGMMGAQLSAMGGNAGMGQLGGSQLGAMGGYGAGGQNGNQQGGGGQQQGGQQQGGQQQGGQQQGGNQQKQPWNPAAIQSLDLSQQQGSIQFTQILDLVDSSVTIGGQGGGGQGGGGQGGGGQGGNQGGGQQRGGQTGQGGTAYSSPISSSPIALAEALPVLMEKLTTVDAEAIPGRINIMECPRELLAGIPGMTTELVDSILQARSDGAQTDNRRFETWLAAEGLVTIDQMRAFMPLVTCGGDVFKAQVIGYYEGSAPFCRAEAIISGVGATPQILFYRRLDHLGRGFDVATLGQRLDVGSVPTTVQR